LSVLWFRDGYICSCLEASSLSGFR